ncbi:MAG TPA: site-2 protease family protein [Gemmatimonadaceae bacterium]|nr:site-2 protease family protein [Gemmatimonadaceae bacterium]
MTEVGVTQYLTYWRSASFGNREIVEGLVAREHDGPSRVLAQRLAEWDGTYYWENAPEGRWLVLVREAGPPRERWWLHIALFAVVLITASLGGAALTGAPDSFWALPTPSVLRSGLPFALPLLAILLAHESGHYVAARRYRVDASPPYFIPFLPQLNAIGTLGAFIRLRSVVFDRRTLFDIGVAGPLAGIIVAIPMLLVGLVRSATYPLEPNIPLAHQYVLLWGQPLFLGDSLFMRGARALVGAHGVLHLNPVAFAGWVGILVTMLNLLPLAQLDGGHIAFALFGRRQTWIARVFWVVLVLMGWFYWRGWWLWAVLGLALGRGKLAHPPLVAEERSLDASRRWIGWLVIALFVLTFMPLPIPV